MSESTSLFEAAGTAIIGIAYVAYAWHKKRTEFGERLYHVRVYSGDHEVRCHVCQGNTFYKREALINTTWVSLFKLDPLNESAHCVVCEGCGYAHWFAARPGVGTTEYLRYEGEGASGGREL